MFVRVTFDDGSSHRQQSKTRRFPHGLCGQFYISVAQQAPTCKALLRSGPTLCNPVDRGPRAPLSVGFSEQNAGVGCHVLFREGIFPTQAPHPAYPMPPALAGWSFTTSTTWKSPIGSTLESNKTSFLCSNSNFTNSEIRLCGEQRDRIPSALTPLRLLWRGQKV